VRTEKKMSLQLLVLAINILVLLQRCF